MTFDNEASRKIKKKISLATVMLLWIMATNNALAHNTPSQIQAGEIPQGLTASEWNGIQSQVVAKRYHSQGQQNGSIKATNTAHNWRIHYQTNGMTSLTPKNSGDYSIDMKLTGLGYQQLVPITQPIGMTHKDHTVTYQWSLALKEIWSNSAQSLEQWFILQQPPTRHQLPEHNSTYQPLTLSLSVATDLSLSQKADGLHFSNAQGIDITYNKLKVWDSKGRILPAQMHLAENKTVLLHIDDSQAQYPLTIDPQFQQQAYLKASNTGAGDNFGGAVAVSGDTVVVGALAEDSAIIDNEQDDSASNAGAAYVFIRDNTGSWSQQAYLKASNVGVGDQFGVSVAVSGDTVVVGAWAEDSAIIDNEQDDSALDAGAAYVFIRDDTDSWSQQAYLKASNAESGDGFGRSVTVSGDTVVVGAYREDSATTGVDSAPDDFFPDAGAAYVFIRDDTDSWNQQAYLKASNTGTNDQFGISVAVSDDTVVVGAYREDSAKIVDELDNSADGAGAAYVFIRDDTNSWSQQAYLKASNTGASDWFGISAAVSGDTVVVGALFEDSSTTEVNSTPDNLASQAGAVYVFIRDDTDSWSQQAYLKASNTGANDWFGISVAVSGDTVMVGAYREDNSTITDELDNSAIDAGAAYVFIRDDTDSWSQQTYLKAFNAETEDWFGRSVAVSGDTLVVGADREDSSMFGVGSMPDESASNSGAAYVMLTDLIFADGFDQ